MAWSRPPTLIWRGDITTYHNVVLPIAKAWHAAGHPKLTLQPFNTISGIDAVAKGSADIGGSVRGRAPRRADEAGLKFTPVAWDALVIIVSRHNPVTNLTLKQLHDIYYGRRHNWRTVGGSDQPIHVYAVASPTDGIEFSLRRLLFGHGNQPVAAPRLYLTTTALEEAVALDPRAMGVSTLSDATQMRHLKMLSIDGVAPTHATVKSGTYALYTPLYLVTRQDATVPGSAKSREIAAFLTFAQSQQAASLLRKHGLIPYAQAPALAGHDAARIKAIAADIAPAVTAGTRPAASKGN